MPLRQVGQRIRTQRRHLGISQVVLAKKVGISPSYLNLIEHNKRRIGGTLLRHLADALELDVQSLSGAEEARLASELIEVASDPVFAETPYTSDEAVSLAASAPSFARAILSLFRALKSAQEHLDMMSEHLVQTEVSHEILTLITSIRSFSEILQDYGDLDEAQRSEFLATTVEETERLTRLATEMFDSLGGTRAINAYPSPTVEVADIIEDQNNHFPTLEAAAAAIRARLGDETGLLKLQLQRHLHDVHGIRVEWQPDEAVPTSGHRFHERERRLELAYSLPAESVRFQLARLVGWLEAKEVILDILTATAFSGPEAEQRCEYALSSYLAGALLFPYDEFLDAACLLRYDIEQLQHRFGGSFEQICHRLTTLRRPGKEGVPFHFLRTDIAGNIDKRFSASSLELPRHSSACPRWVIYEAFLTPGRLCFQVAQMEDSSSYLFVSRTLNRPRTRHGAPTNHQSVMIGCDVAYARSIVYSDGIDITTPGTATPVGVRCRQCTRENCGQRTAPAIGNLLSNLGFSSESTPGDDKTHGSP